MAKLQRTVDIAFINAGTDIVSVEYNPASGAQKSLIVGPRLLPVPIAAGYTTNASGGLVLPYLGANLAIYNNSGTAGSITASAAVAASLAIGVTDASGNVGVACPPNAWSYLSMGNNQYIITSAATVIVYIIEDPTKITQETGPYAQQNAPIQPIS
jgi:hypothetical protein